MAISASRTKADPSPPSPCTGVCTLDETRQRCVGCHRTLAEIARWSNAGDEEKRAILARIAALT